ncbi:MAG TPA: hypothetical protein VGM90_36665 [Kofleriaceae bacterium]|jgi:hypothetical protein
MTFLVRVAVFGTAMFVGGAAVAGPVSGKLDLTAATAERPPAATKGWLDRVENPLAPARPVNVTSQMIVVLDGAKPSSPGQVTWELVGESFGHPVMGAPAGAEVLIKNLSGTARTLIAAEDPKLIPAGPLNPKGSKSFRTTEANKIYTVSDSEAVHLKGKLVVVDSQYVTTVDEGGKFEFGEVAEGSYKLRIFYKDGWLDGTTDVVVGAKGKTEVNPKVPALTASAKK